jgi:hypothetical protein
MNLREEIRREHSKAQCDKIVDWVGNSQQRFDELFQLFLNDEYLVKQRAAWPVSYCVEAHPQLIQKHLLEVIKNLKKNNLHNAVKRNSIRLLQYISIPKKCQGDIMNICFGYLASPIEPVAVKVFSMTVLANLAKDFPEIIPEIKLLIEDQLPYQRAGFINRGKKILKQLSS